MQMGNNFTFGNSRTVLSHILMVRELNLPMALQKAITLLFLKLRAITLNFYLMLRAITTFSDATGNNSIFSGTKLI